MNKLKGKMGAGIWEPDGFIVDGSLLGTCCSVCNGELEEVEIIDSNVNGADIYQWCKNCDLYWWVQYETD